MYWGANLAVNNSISHNGMWINVDGSDFNFTLVEKRTVVISYEAVVQSLRNNLLGNPLPREGSMDTLQMRCLINGVPYRYTSGFASTYGVEPTALTRISSAFALELPASTHTVTVQWKKIGQQVNRWELVSGGSNKGFSIVVHADFSQVFYLQETRDNFLLVNDVWRPLTNDMVMDLDRSQTVTVTYSLTVQPQLLSFIKDRVVEYVSTRVSVDGVAYTDSAESFGTNAWNPQSATIRGSFRVLLQAGKHVVKLEWKKAGTAFKSWSSNPSFIDGFAASRNLIVSLDKFSSPSVSSHTVNVLPPSDNWVTVADSAVNLHLTKESAVLISYALPVTQYENPNLDANVWSSLTQVDSRLVIDSIAYTFEGSTVATTARRYDDMFGQLALTLPAGTHFIALQWRSEKVRWIDLNNINGGFAHGSKLLTFVSSENAQPIITAPDVLYGTEDVVLTITSILVADVDAEISAGMLVSVNLTTHTGLLAFPNLPLFAREVDVIHSEHFSTVMLIDSIDSINQALNGMLYIAPLLWNGRDILQINMSDLGGVGYAAPLFTSTQVEIVFEAVDNPFTLTTPQHIQADLAEVDVIPISPIVLYDVDSTSSDFTAQIAATCGFVSIQANSQVLDNLQFITGNANQSTSMFIQGKYDAIRRALLSLTYLPYTSCDRTLHVEIVALTVVNTNNLSQNITRLTVLDILRPKVKPAIFTTKFPRWKVVGLKKSDNSASFTYSFVGTPDIQYALQDAVTLPKANAAQSELVLIEGNDMHYALNVRYSSVSVRTLGSNYVVASQPKQFYFTLIPRQNISGDDELYCYLNGTQHSRVSMLADSVYLCVLTTTLPDSVHWLKVTGSAQNISFETNFVPLFSVPMPQILAVSPKEIFGGATAPVVEIQTSSPTIVAYCLVENQVFSAYTDEFNKTRCRLSKVPDNISHIDLVVASSDFLIFSSTFAIVVQPAPVLNAARLVESNMDGSLSLILSTSWAEDVDLEAHMEKLYCIYNNQSFPVTYISQRQDVYCDVKIPLVEAMLCSQGSCTAGICLNSLVVDGGIVAGLSYSSIPVVNVLPTFFVAPQILAGAEYLSIFTSGSNNELPVIPFYCVVDSVKIATIRKDSAEIICPLPPQIVSGKIPLVTDNMVQVFEADVTVVAIPSLLRYRESTGYIISEQEIEIEFESSLPSGKYSCMVHHTNSVAATILSENILRCPLTQTSRLANTPLHLYFNNMILPNIVIGLKPLQAAQVQAIQPAFANIQGGVTISVIGSNFDILKNDKAIDCLFGETSVAATVLDDNTIECTVPVSPRPVIVPFLLQVSGGAIITTSLRFQYISPIMLRTISPTSGSVHGADRVLVKAYNIPTLPSVLACKFGELVVPAKYMDEETLECVSPAYIQGSVLLSIVLIDSQEKSNGLTYTFKSRLQVQSLQPAIVARRPYVAFTIRANAFSAGDRYECFFNGAVGRFAVTSALDARCEVVIPSSQLIKQAALVVAVNNVSISTHVVDIVDTQLTGVFPTIGNIQGGDIITITVQGVSTALSNGFSNVYCLIGHIVEPAVFLNETDSLACLSPAVKSPGPVLIDIVYKNNSLIAEPVSFLYVNPVVITGIDPRAGPISGNTRVAFFGVGFLSQFEFSCAFGNEETSGRFVNSSLVECVTPASHRSGTVDAVLYVKGYASSLPPYHFTYAPDLKVVSIEPSVVPSDVGQSLTFSGRNFSPLYAYKCNVAGLFIDATYISATALQCLPPALSPGSYNIQLLADNIPASFNVTTKLRVVEPLFIESIEPVVALAAEPIAVKVLGQGFDLIKAQNSTVLCRFGDFNSSAHVQDDGISCRSPASDIGAQYTFSLLVDGQDVPQNSLKFIAIEKPYIVRYAPLVVLSDGTSSVVVSGSGFSNVNARCIFDKIETPARYINSTRIFCPTPALDEGMKSFNLSFGNYTVKVSETLQVINTPAIMSISPQIGSSTGRFNTTLLVNMSSMAANQVTACVIGSTQAAASINDLFTIVCSAPPMSPGSYAVGLAMGDLIITSSLVLEYNFTPLITSAYPNQITVGTSLLVYGRGFDSSRTYKCGFNRIRVAGLLSVDGNSLTCITPSLQSTNRIITLTIVVDDEFEVDTPVQLNFGQAPELYSSEFDRYFLSANNSILLNGNNFDQVSSLECVFGGLAVSAVVINSTLVECAMPYQVSTGEKSYGVVYDGNIVLAEGSIVFDSLCVVSFVEPSVGSTSGGSILTVSGSGFLRSPSIFCSFGDISIPGLYVADKEVQCSSPPHEEGLVQVGVEINGVSCLSMDSPSFNFAPYPHIESVNPIVLTDSTTSVQAHGQNFFDGFTYMCHFGDVAVQANKANSSVYCDVDAVLLNNMMTEQHIDFYITTRESTVISNRIMLYYSSLISVEYTNMRFVSKNGGDNIIVTLSFLPTVNLPLTCMFGETKVTAVAESENLISCSTPPFSSVGDVFLSVDIGGHIATAGILTILDTPTVLDFSPKIVDSTGTSTVIVTVTEVLIIGELFCRYGDVSVPIITASENKIECPTVPFYTNRSTLLITTGKLQYYGTVDLSVVDVDSPVVFGNDTANSDKGQLITGVNPEWVLSATNSPRSIIYIYGGPFENGNLLCVRDMQKFPALFIDSTTLQCPLTTLNKQNVSFAIVDMTNTSLYQQTLSVVELPVLQRIDVSTGGLAVLSLSDIDKNLMSIDWYCEYSGGSVKASIVNNQTAACIVSLPTLRENDSFVLVADVYGIRTSTNAVNSSATVTFLDHSSDGLLALQPSLVRANSTALYAIYQKLVSLQSNASLLGLPYAKLSNYENLEEVDVGESVVQMSTNVFTGCSINNEDCWDYATFSSFHPANQSSSSLSIPLANNTLPIISSTNPNFLSTDSNTWLTVAGRGFHFDSRCVLDNVTTLTSTVMSESLMTCLVPSLNVTRRQEVTLTISNGDRLKSPNSVRLWYNMWERYGMQHVLSSFNDTNTVDGEVIPSSDRVELCLSKVGCTAMSRSPSLAQDHEHALLFRHLDGKNASFFYSNITYSQFVNSIEEPILSLVDPLSSIDIYYVDQTQFSTSCQSCFISFYGSGFVDGQFWCLDYQNERLACNVLAGSNSLRCSLPELMYPGVWMANLLKDCSDPSYSVNITTTPNNKGLLLEPNMAIDATIASISRDPVVSFLEPLFGFFNSSAVIQITLIDLLFTTKPVSCLFVFNDYEVRSTVAEIETSTLLRCKVPAISSLKTASIALVVDNNRSISTGYIFSFMEPPALYSASFTHLSQDRSLYIAGDGFSRFSHLFCKVHYEGVGSSIVIIGSIIDDKEAQCSPMPQVKFRVQSVEVSFNGIDYYSPAALNSQGSESTTSSSLWPVISRPLTFADNSNSFISPESAHMYWSCDSYTFLTFDLSTVLQDNVYECFTNNRSTGLATLRTNDQTTCEIPALPPGDYPVHLHSTSKLHGDLKAVLHCIAPAKILSLSLLPVVGYEQSTILIEGLNFQAGTTLMCMLGNEGVVATIESNRIAACSYQYLVPGEKVLKIVQQGETLWMGTVCMSSSAIIGGGELSLHSEGCIAKMPSLVQGSSSEHEAKSIITYTLRSILPSSGPIKGSTRVSISADLINFRSDLVCVFDQTQTPAIVVDYDKVVCESPSHVPGNVTVQLSSLAEPYSWCCASYYYHPNVAILSFSPRVLNGQYSSLVTLRVDNLPQSGNVYCLIAGGSIVTPTYVLNATHASCSIPPVYSSELSLALGSQSETWTNTISLGVWRSTGSFALSPTIGNVLGGTSVTITLPPVPPMLSPSCLIGADIISPALYDSKNGIVVCKTVAQLSQSVVDVFIVDQSSTEEPPEYFVGTFRYIANAEISNVNPTSLPRGRKTNLVVYGVYFLDSPMLSCVINNNIIQARWLSSERILCEVASQQTLGKNNVSIAVSNNAQDLSTTFVTLRLTDAIEVLEVVPKQGFTSGGTEVKTIFKHPSRVQLYCSFNGYKVLSIQNSENSIGCLTPKSEAGVQVVLLVDRSGNEYATFEFTFFSVPLPKLVSQKAILKQVLSSVSFTSTLLPIGLHGRLREVDGSIIDAHCMLVNSSSFLCDGILTNTAKPYLALDLSMNGADYVNDLVLVPVYTATRVEWVDPLFVFDIGNTSLQFGVDRHFDGHPLVCAFEKSVYQGWRSVYLPVHEVMATWVAERVLECKSPSLSLADLNFFSVREFGNSIFGPHVIITKPVPVVEMVATPSVISGIPQKVIVSFQQAIPALPKVQLSFQDKLIPLDMVNSTTATCYLQSQQAGIFPLYLASEVGSGGFYTKISNVEVLSDSRNVKFNTTSIVRDKANSITVEDSSCLWWSTVFCHLDGGKCSVDAKTDCFIVLQLSAHIASSNALLKICSEPDCIRPVVIQRMRVLPVVNILTLTPSFTTYRGGNTVTIFGSGFVRDGSFECSFGSTRVPARVFNETIIQCIAPAIFVQSVNVTILHEDHLVSYQPLPFNFVSLLAIREVEPKSLLWSGGTLVTFFTETHPEHALYECRFNEKFVPATIIDSKTTVCRAPSFDISHVELAITADRADISEVVSMDIVPPLTVVYLEPTVVAPSQVSTIMLILGESAATYSDILCYIDSIPVETVLSGNTLDCKLQGLPTGEYMLSLRHQNNMVYQYNISVRPEFEIYSVGPNKAFATESVAVTLTTTLSYDGHDYTYCCFGDIKVPALFVSSNQWQCFSPTVNDRGVHRVNYLHVGLAGSDGFCEYSGLEFELIPPLEVTSLSPSTGLTNGGTMILLETERPLLSDDVYCSIAGTVGVGQYVSEEGIYCVTNPSPPGSYEVYLSVNGKTFLPSGFAFEFRYPLPTEPIQYTAPRPVLFRLSTYAFPASAESNVEVIGRFFSYNSVCMIGYQRSIETKFVSNTSLICTIPVHSPSPDALYVMNIDGQQTRYLNITFIKSPSVGGTGYLVSPTFGPRTGYTVITITGQNLGSIPGARCQIGDEVSFAYDVTNTSLKCTAPPSDFSGQVSVKLMNNLGDLVPGRGLFEYRDNPVLLDVRPNQGIAGTEVTLIGSGFAKYDSLSAIFGADPPCIIQSDARLICTVPDIAPGEYDVSIVTSDQNTVTSGMVFTVLPSAKLNRLWPYNGPALRGGTILSIFGENFPSTVDVHCLVDGIMIHAFTRSSDLIQCKTMPHRPGRVKVGILADGVLIHSPQTMLDFVYAPDVSVDKITPEFGYTAGEFPVIVFGSNFVNTSSLGCMFADMKSRAIFLSKNALVCLSPSPLGRAELVNLDAVAVEVTVNGLDYSESNVTFAYSQPCDQGFFCPGMTRQLCPNGTYCPENSRNFTLCEPGTFQPMQGQTSCVICPVGYICPDMGMPRPIICPAGLICDIMGLRASTKLCPAGRYCLNGTKSSSIDEFEARRGWLEDYVSGVVFFNASAFQYDFNAWPLPAIGQSRPQAPPESSCDGLVCSGGSSNVLAEAPFPCPIGHYCRAGAGTQIPMPKNFSSPQRCFDGFFCPRGSVSPEGSGPCPNGYFCPTQMDAIICPAGHYCPGVGNTNPIECYPGTYNPLQGKANCTVCPSGHICPGWGLFLPELCPAGFVCVSLGLSYPVALCPQGYYCEEGTLTLDPSDTTTLKPKVCKEGEFCLGGVSSTINVEWIPSQPYGASHPQICSEGTYCQAGAYLTSGSGLCFKGHYCPPNSSFPNETPVGNFASGLGSVAPTLCFPGSYAPLQAQVDCLVCPAGHTCTSYGTYIPTICEAGTYRSLIDSVTCTPCPTGTYSTFVGSPDISLCLPCPQGRICGVKNMIDLAQSDPCPAGYICGYGSDRSSQFDHFTPAGFHTTTDSTPYVQFESACAPGFYCRRGTPTYLQFGGKCTVGSYCPQSTPAAITADVKCPLYTSSLSGTAALQGCRIADINVCDKSETDLTNPMEDVTFYNKFSYALMDDSNSVLLFDSSTSATTPTGEVRTVAKVYPLNQTSSSPTWVNDTIEAFRACPLYGSGNGGETITIIGRNFLNNDLNFCKFRACYSSNLGKHIGRCKNQVRSPTGLDLDKAGNVSDASIITKARFISSTRIECTTPEFIFNRNIQPSLEVNDYECRYLDAFGNPVSNSSYGNYSFVRTCYNPADCRNKPSTGLEYFISLTFPCSIQDEILGVCANTPELGYMMNPCISAEAIVEVTNDGEHYSGGIELLGQSILSTVRYGDGGTIYNFFKNFTRNSTFAVFTYVYPEYFYTNPEILEMERGYCSLPRYSEESPRERESGYYLLKLQETAHVQVDLSFLPDNMVYGEHYSIAIFVAPSRCKVELCNSVRVRLSPEEFLPCRKPIDYSYWFSQTDVPKNVRNNFTLYALDDVIFKVEVHLLYGLYTAYAPLFQNTTTVQVMGPGRARTFEGASFSGTSTRKLSPYVSFNEQLVTMQYFFCAVVYRTDSEFVSQPLNLPPLYSDFERGRVLVLYNVSSQNTQIPLKIDPLSLTNKGVEFWLMPATTPSESKELLDTYFETFHNTIYDNVNGYQFEFTTLLMGYLPYFSNCYGFDSYIPIWALVESPDCELPDIYPDDWPRYKFPPLPDQDHIRFVGPFDFFEDPIADWCERTITCNYEEDMSGQDNTPRWFELGTDDSLFQLIRVPLNYYEYTGRKATTVSSADSGGGAVVATLQEETGDNFIPVTIDHLLGDLIPGCILQCFARSYTLTIAYYQEDFYNKRIILATLAGDDYDFDQDKTEYSLHVSYYALSFIELVLNFAFDLSIFIVIFCFVGFLMVFLSFIGWSITRATTLLQNPPQLKFMNMLALIVPPPLAGVTMAVVLIWILVSLGNYIINGYFFSDPNSPAIMPLGEMSLDAYPLQYGNLGALVTVDDQQAGRHGRMGSVFFIVGWCCFIVSSKLYFPRDESKREREVAKKRTKLAHKRELWDPVMWKKANFMLTSFVLATVLTLIIELSYSDLFGLYFYQVIVFLILFGEIMKVIAGRQLNDAILVAPLECAWGFTQGLIGFGSPDFYSFIAQNFMDFGVVSFQRIFQDVYVNGLVSITKYVVANVYEFSKRLIPKYFTANKGPITKKDEENAKDFRKRAVEGVAEVEEESESVEPILEYFAGCAGDATIIVYFPFFVYLLMQYRETIQIPDVYGIRQSDMMIYLVYQLFFILIQPIVDVLNHSQCELYHGWKIYEYLVYSRYRFLQRETRWKGMEPNLDECIEESLRRLDQMCFSSQYFFMLTFHLNGIVFIAISYEVWLFWDYSPFSDSAFFIVFGYMVSMYLLLRWVVFYLSVRLKVYRIKHENTAWHLIQKEDDELDVPAWEEIKGASTEAFLMNQRITSETFRYKFLNYNRTWLINQLPQLLTPRTLRRSRPYLINQFARIINARRDDISDDSEEEAQQKFGPVALTAPSRNIIRHWLGRARRR
ncbi:hypothetical protein EON65_02100 [archaeon]|nr:MAG: hypothetical protein EON65_02100 [archaeon]